MTKTGKVELSNYQILKIVSWYNNNFKPSDSNKELPMKLRLNFRFNRQCSVIRKSMSRNVGRCSERLSY